MAHRVTSTPFGKTLALAGMIAAPAAFLLSIPVLMQQPDAVVFAVAGLASFVTVAAGFAHSVIGDRQMDEWHRTASRFAHQWGFLVGSGLFALSLALPPVHGFVRSAAGAMAAGGIGENESALLLVTFTFMAVVVVQALSMAALSVLWRWRMARAI